MKSSHPMPRCSYVGGMSRIQAHWGYLCDNLKSYSVENYGFSTRYPGIYYYIHTYED